ncbi:DUF5590 domain-containing protein [Streptococcus salivarius]|uniref:cell wall elongation regulator TseB-like domain-containing protein n=1 Tax=Streptococcus salivarius TaxID=1304 RepID=UPI0039C11084
MRKQRSPWTKKQQLIFGIIVIVVTLIASVTAILIVATKPYVDAEKKVIAIAESKADIRTVTEFDIYHGESTYYGLLGKSSQGEKLAVIMSPDSGVVDIYKQSDGISKSVAKKAAKAYGAKAYGAKEISYVHLGKYGKTPIWEVKSGTQYYLVDFISGQVIKVEGL